MTSKVTAQLINKLYERWNSKQRSEYDEFFYLASELRDKKKKKKLSFITMICTPIIMNPSLE